jgi:hypothetical protein
MEQAFCCKYILNIAQADACAIGGGLNTLKITLERHSPEEGNLLLGAESYSCSSKYSARVYGGTNEFVVSRRGSLRQAT